jgi:transcriptional regulator GlxA family with amidase domain
VAAMLTALAGILCKLALCKNSSAYNTGTLNRAGATMTELQINRRTLIGAATLAATGLAARAKSVPKGLPERIHPPVGKIAVAIILDEGATVIDFAGPWETFQDAHVGEHPGFELFTVAPGKVIQTTGNSSATGMTGLSVTVDHVFPDAPQPNVIVMGAQSGNQLPAKLEWIRAMAPKADIVMSVCTGAFVLARTGLIDGLYATTHHEFYASFEETFPKVKLVRGRRFVDNGKFLSAGGLTSGIDASLHVISRYFGQDNAAATANYMEHYSDGWRTGVRA